MSSISSISGNGSGFSRPIKRLAGNNSNHVQDFTYSKAKDKDSRETTFNLESNKNRLKESYKNDTRHKFANNEKVIVDFISHLQKLPPSSDKVSNTYHQVGNYEKQQEVQKYFGIDIYA
ncbi:MAG: hypothetical protein OEX19_01895 [Gammaproteobacteria bacterium]|nr:hypothetical protein [Gammaproteobacteria bacterium]